jgi:predicted NBD/HSP70 family sugar kinase
MRFYTKPHKFYCGIDVHARTMSLCILNQVGEILRHRHMQAAPEPFLQAIAPSRDDLVGCAEWTLDRVLAGRPLRLRGDSLRPGPCPLYAGYSWREGPERYNRCP